MKNIVSLLLYLPVLVLAQANFVVHDLNVSGDEYILGDFSGNGITDIVLRDGSNLALLESASLGVYNDPNPIRDLSSDLNIEEYSQGITSGDITGDGLSDIFIMGDFKLSWIANNTGNLSGSIDSDYDPDDYRDCSGIGDYCDEIKEIVEWKFWNNRGGITHYFTRELWGQGLKSNYLEHLVSHTNNGSGSFGRSYRYYALSTPYEIAVHDFDNDNEDDLMFLNHNLVSGWCTEGNKGGLAYDFSGPGFGFEPSDHSFLCAVQLDGEGPDETMLIKNSISSSLGNLNVRVIWSVLDQEWVENQTLVSFELSNYEYAEAGDFDESNVSEELISYSDSALFLTYLNTDGSISSLDNLAKGAFDDLQLIDLNGDSRLDFLVLMDGSLKWFENTIATGIHEEHEVNYAVYPNPTSNELNIHCEEPIDYIQLVGLDGQLIATYDQSNISLGETSSAIILLEIHLSNGVVLREKILKN